MYVVYTVSDMNLIPEQICGRDVCEQRGFLLCAEVAEPTRRRAARRGGAVRRGGAHTLLLMLLLSWAVEVGQPRPKPASPSRPKRASRTGARVGAASLAMKRALALLRVAASFALC